MKRVRKQVTLRADVNQQRELTQGQRQALEQMTRHEGWEVFLDLFEEECLFSLGEALNARTDDDRLANLKSSQAWSEAFVKLQKRVQYEISEGEAKRAPKPLTEEQKKERFVAATVDAVQAARQNET